MQAAQAKADEAAVLMQQAADAVAAAQARIAHFSRDSYMSGSGMSEAAALLEAFAAGRLDGRDTVRWEIPAGARRD